MTITAELHDGRTLEFPDGTDPAVVQATVKRVLGVKQEAKSSTDQWLSDYQKGHERTAQMIGNIPGSAAKFFGGVAESFLHPIDTATNMLDLGAGALRNITPKPVSDLIDRYDPNPEAGARASAVANKVGDVYKDRYGGLENIKRTVIEDPVGAAADLSTVLGVGGAVVPGRAGAALSTAANYTNPLSIVPASVNAVTDASKWASNSLMHSAIKPSLKQLKRGDADIAIQELLDRGISPTRGGVEKIRNLVSEKNDQISNALKGSNAAINPADVAAYTSEVRRRFMNQVDPIGDLDTIRRVDAGWAGNPKAQGPIPVSEAQQMKVGTYQALKDKYGQIGSAETEAQKALARGLKEEIAAKVPQVAQLNAEESKLLSALNVSERRAFLELNKNPIGLSFFVTNPKLAALYMADKSGPFKALLARVINRTGVTAPEAVSNVLAPIGNPARAIGVGAGQLTNALDQ